MDRRDFYLKAQSGLSGNTEIRSRRHVGHMYIPNQTRQPPVRMSDHRIQGQHGTRGETRGHSTARYLEICVEGEGWFSASSSPSSPSPRNALVNLSGTQTTCYAPSNSPNRTVLSSSLTGLGTLHVPLLFFSSLSLLLPAAFLRHGLQKGRGRRLEHAPPFSPAVS